MIKEFRRSSEDLGKLDKIKKNTEMEINLRYLKSETNKKYKFPRNYNPESDSDED